MVLAFANPPESIEEFPHVDTLAKPRITASVLDLQKYFKMDDPKEAVNALRACVVENGISVDQSESGLRKLSGVAPDEPIAETNELVRPSFQWHGV